MGNWIPGDPTLVAQILKISSSYTPPPPEGFVSPMLWGVESNIIERFEAAGIPRENISFSRETFTFSAPVPPAEFLKRFRDFYGPTMNAFEAAEKNGKAGELQNAGFNSVTQRICMNCKTRALICRLASSGPCLLPSRSM